MIRRRNERWWIGVLMVGVALACPLTMLRADEPAAPNDKRIDAAMAKGVTYLLSVQNQDGSICDVPRHKTAMTSLAIMAMAGTGIQPTDDTPEGKAMAKALGYVLNDKVMTHWGKGRGEDLNYFGQADGSRMYGHGITTLMLAEMLGMGVDEKQDRLIHEKLRNAVDLILQSQQMPKKEKQFEGGWRYQPDSNDADLSVTVWQVMALRAAYNAGLDVPSGAIDKAVRYIEGSYASPRNADGKPTNLISGCSYQPGGGTTFSTASEGLLSLQVCGRYEALEVEGASEWLMQHPAPRNDQWFYYGSYYLAQGMYQRGGKYAPWAAKLMNESMLPRQEAAGSWELGEGQEKNSGKVYTTAMAMLSLSIKYHYLPIYQR